MSDVQSFEWSTVPSLEDLNRMLGDTLCSTLGMEITDVGSSASLTASMPVDRRTCQPFKILHGGASVALAESLASIGAYYCRKTDGDVFGIEINANHIKAVSVPSTVTATGRPVHLGRTLQVWQVDIHDPSGNMVCTCRVTLLCVNRA